MGRPGSHTNPTEIKFLWDCRLVRTKLYVSGRYAHGKYNNSDTCNLRARKIQNCVFHTPQTKVMGPISLPRGIQKSDPNESRARKIDIWHFINLTSSVVENQWV